MTARVERIGRAFVVGQTALLGAFFAILAFGPGPPLFAPGAPAAVGLALCAAGFLLMVLGLASIRGNIQVAPEPRTGARLVTTGAYRYLRHPIYTALLVVVVGLFLCKPTTLVGISGALVMAFLAMKVRFEEQRLLATYPEYRDYRTRTWGLIPGLRW